MSMNIDNSLGKDQFLKLFTVQARMQNPMNPTEGSDFLAQLAQFSSLEQMGNLNTNMEKMLSDQKQTNMYQLIGKEVSYLVDDQGETNQGVVRGITTTSMGPMLLVGNHAVSMQSVTGVFAAEKGSDEDKKDASAAGLLGDIDGDGSLTTADLIGVRENMGTDPSSSAAAAKADLNRDGKVDEQDMRIMEYLLSMQG